MYPNHTNKQYECSSCTKTCTSSFIRVCFFVCGCEQWVRAADVTITSCLLLLLKYSASISISVVGDALLGPSFLIARV